MFFTTDCFVRIKDEKERKEIKEQLVDMGREIFGQMRFLLDHRLRDEDAVYCDGNFYAFFKPPFFNLENAINCGTNIPLFLALAALRDDSDYKQWFCIKKPYEHWKLCTEGRWDRFRVKNETIEHLYFGYHKATVEELVEHFKN